MGKQSRRVRMKDVDATNECPVCTDSFKDVDGSPDNALGCKNKHLICVECVSRLVEPTPKCGPTCSMLQYTCPLCRTESCISNVHLLVIVKRSWSQAFKCFPCEHAVHAWNARSE